MQSLTNKVTMGDSSAAKHTLPKQSVEDYTPSVSPCSPTIQDQSVQAQLGSKQSTKRKLLNVQVQYTIKFPGQLTSAHSDPGSISSPDSSHLGAQDNMVREEKRAEGQGVGADGCEQDTRHLRVKGEEMSEV